MWALIKIILVLTLVVVLILRRVNIGNTMLVGSLGLFLLSWSKIQVLLDSLKQTIFSIDSWNILLAVYFIMCLEYLFRIGGVMDGFLAWTRQTFCSEKVLLPTMPAFLGLLPSLGGAMFSAPFVENAGQKFGLSPERKTAINYWFRHVWEFTNPIIPAVLLASEITKIPLGNLISNQVWITLEAILLGWLVLLTGKSFKRKFIDRENEKGYETNLNSDLSNAGSLMEKIQDDRLGKKEKVSNKYLFLAVGPVLINVVLVTFFKLNAALAIGIIVLSLALVLNFQLRDLQKMLLSSLDGKLLWSIASVLFFEKVLVNTGMVKEVVAFYLSSGLSIPLIAGLTAFTVGFLTGVNQATVAIAFPIITAIMPGNLALIAIGFVVGQAGQMLSPAHLCLVLTLDYFKANFFRTLQPILIIEIIMVLSVYLVTAIIY